jgi:hypothetical protein
MTAWALLGLLAADYPDHTVLTRGLCVRRALLVCDPLGRPTHAV